MGWISSEGPFVGEFERRFAERVGRRHGVTVCNGFAALDAAVAALGVGPGDEVLMPTFTIISCASAPAAERIARRGFCLPSGLALTDEQMQRVAAAVRKVFA